MCAGFLLITIALLIVLFCCLLLFILLQMVLHIPVTDLHSVSPSSFLEVSGGTVHALSYQQVCDVIGTKHGLSIYEHKYKTWVEHL